MHLGDDDEPDQVLVGIETDRRPWVQALVAAGYQVWVAVGVVAAGRVGVEDADEPVDSALAEASTCASPGSDFAPEEVWRSRSTPSRPPEVVGIRSCSGSKPSSMHVGDPTTICPTPSSYAGGSGQWAAIPRGLVVVTAGPEGWPLFLAIVPQFLPLKVPVLEGVLVLGAIDAAVVSVYFAVVACITARAVEALRGPKVVRFIDRAPGAVLIALGLGTAAEAVVGEDMTALSLDDLRHYGGGLHCCPGGRGIDSPVFAGAGVVLRRPKPLRCSGRPRCGRPRRGRGRAPAPHRRYARDPTGRRSAGSGCGTGIRWAG